MKQVFYLIAVVFVTVVVATAQDRTITGTVTDNDGSAVAGAIVKVKGTKTGTYSRSNGGYTVKAAEAHAAFVAAVKASLARTGVSDADATAFMAQANVDPGATALTLENIMTQKYVAMYTQCESWTDWRRTGFPALTAVRGNEVPRRFPYPQSERLYNTRNMPAGLTIFSRVWWDK